MSVLLAVTAHRVTRWLPPAVGAWSLAWSAVVVAVSTVWSLSLLRGVPGRRHTAHKPCWSS
jgi:hypothetical protein